MHSISCHRQTMFDIPDYRETKMIAGDKNKEKSVKLFEKAISVLEVKTLPDYHRTYVMMQMLQ